MRRVATWVRVLFGFLYFGAGASWFIPGFPKLGTNSLWFTEALAASGLFVVVKVMEFVFGTCLLGNRFVPGAIACLCPISFVIGFNDVFIEHSVGFAAIGVAVVVANLFLMAMYSEYFLPLLVWRPQHLGGPVLRDQDTKRRLLRRSNSVVSRRRK